MREAEAGWGKYALEMVHSREEAEQKSREWEVKAQSLPGAEVRVLSWGDPLGGETFVLCTETLELVPQHLRAPIDEVLKRLEEAKRTASREDREAFEVAEQLLKGQDLEGGARRFDLGHDLDERVERLRQNGLPFNGRSGSGLD